MEVAMTEQTGPVGGDVERGASEEASGAPLTETEVEISSRPPSEPDDDPGGAATSGRPDATG
jgi:hypothetical protein